MYVRNCQTDRESSKLDNQAFFIRAVKTLRILKLTRLLKVFKLFSILEERLDLNPGTMRILKLVFTLGTAIHLYACAFWLIKSETFDNHAIDDWLQSRDVDRQEVGEVYVVCLYFITTVFTTVGFGDISALNHQERIFVIFMECTACLFFGIILSELQGIYTAHYADSRDLAEHLASVIRFLKDNRVSGDVQKQVRNWIRFQHVQRKADVQSQALMDTLPPKLRRLLACAMNKGLFAKVSFWSRISNSGSLKDHFTSQLLLRMRTAFYAAGSTVAAHEEQADRIIIILSGQVKVYLPGRSLPLLTLGPGSSIGDNSILEDTRWAGHYGVDADFVAQENCKVCCIASRDVKNVVASSPAFLMIRVLLSSFRFVPDPSADPFDLPDSGGGEETRDRGELDELHRRRQAWLRAAFHWIRFARVRLHVQRLAHLGREAGATGSVGGKELERLVQRSIHHMPVIVPSRRLSQF